MQKERKIIMSQNTIDYIVFRDKMYSFPAGTRIRIDASRLSQNSISDLQWMIKSGDFAVDDSFLKECDYLEQIDVKAGNVILPLCVYIKKTKIQYRSMRHLPEENTLQKRFPELIKQWHPTKNGEVLPNNIRCGSAKKYWWVCEYGHEWEATVVSRTKGVGCRRCRELKKEEELRKKNLTVTHPELANQWHPKLNGELTPDKVTHGSRLRAWCKCEKGHAWQAAVFQRSTGTGCPKCDRIRRQNMRKRNCEAHSGRKDDNNEKE